jgi:hypothetical protein
MFLGRNTSYQVVTALCTRARGEAIDDR